MTHQAEMSFEEAHSLAKQAIVLARQPDTRAALTIIEQIPRKHMVELGRWAVAQRNTDAIDHLPAADRDSAVFAEEFMLLQLSERERAELGIKI